MRDKNASPYDASGRSDERVAKRATAEPWRTEMSDERERVARELDVLRDAAASMNADGLLTDETWAALKDSCAAAILEALRSGGEEPEEPDDKGFRRLEFDATSDTASEGGATRPEPEGGVGEGPEADIWWSQNRMWGQICLYGTRLPMSLLDEHERASGIEEVLWMWPYVDRDHLERALKLYREEFPADPDEGSGEGEEGFEPGVLYPDTEFGECEDCGETFGRKPGERWVICRDCRNRLDPPEPTVEGETGEHPRGYICEHCEATVSLRYIPCPACGEPLAPSMETEMAETREDHDRIYLEPGCDPVGGDRMWCEDKIEDDWVEYVRADGREVEPVAWAVSEQGRLVRVTTDEGEARDHVDWFNNDGRVEVAEFVPLFTTPPATEGLSRKDLGELLDAYECAVGYKSDYLALKHRDYELIARLRSLLHPGTDE